MKNESQTTKPELSEYGETFMKKYVEEKTMNDDITQRIDLASKILITVANEQKSSELFDILQMISDYRKQYILDNSQFGKGA